MYNRIRFVIYIVWCLGILTTSACQKAGDDQKSVKNQDIENGSGDPVVVITERVEARWQALIEGDIQAAYSYISPAGREILPLKNYRRRVKSGMWQDAKVDSMTCNDDICKVTVLLTYNLRDIKGLQKKLQESWINEKGSWWFVQK